MVGKAITALKSDVANQLIALKKELESQPVSSRVTSSHLVLSVQLSPYQFVPSPAYLIYSFDHLLSQGGYKQ